MNKLIFLPLFFAILVLLLCACPDIKNFDKKNFDFKKSEGIFIINEGIFQQANASVYYYDWNQDSVYENIFETVNDEKIGDVLEDMHIFNNNAYLVVNNSAWIDVVDIDNFEKKAEIRGFVSPRYILPINQQKAYVTDLYSEYIYVVDLNKNQVVKRIFTGKWTEKMAYSEGKMFITCPWIYSKPVSRQLLVIDTENDILVDSIVSGINPSDIAVDKNGFLWILNNGNQIKKIPGSIYKIDKNTKSVVDSFIFENTLNIFNSSLKFNENLDSVFVLYNDVYKFSATKKILPEKIILRENRNLYGMNIDNNKNLIIVTDAQNFVEKGKIYIYTKTGKLIKTLTGGYLPSSVIDY